MTWLRRTPQHLAEIEVRDNGKLIAEMAGQLNYVPQWYYYFGGLADKVQGAVIPLDKKGYFNYTRYEPLGVVRGNHAVEFAAHADRLETRARLAAGNTVVMKPSEFTFASVLEFVKLVEQAGFPAGVVNVVTGYGKEAGMPLVEHPLTAKITFTGSDTTGRITPNGRARGFKKVGLELGGKSPNIVFEDAVIEEAVNGRCVRHLRSDRTDLHRGFACPAAAVDPRRIRRKTAGAGQDRREWATR